MVDTVVTPETELEALHKRLKELEAKTEPAVVTWYLKLKAFLNKYIHKYPVYSVWASGILGSGIMYIVRPWLPS